MISKMIWMMISLMMRKRNNRKEVFRQALCGLPFIMQPFIMQPFILRLTAFRAKRIIGISALNIRNRGIEA